MSSQNFVVEDYAGITVVTLMESSLLDSGMIDRLGRELYKLPDEQNKRSLILDFCNVKFLSSHSIGVILTLQKKLAAIKGSLALCGLRPELMKVFTITNLHKVLKFYKNDAEALAAYDVHVK